jgi:hypothetical protein
MDKDEKSLEVQESHKRALDLAKAPLKGLIKGLIEEAENIPGVALSKNIFNETAKGVVEYMAQVKRDDYQDRFYRFHNAVFFENVSDEERKKLLENLSKVEDPEYLAMVETVLKDDEAEKVKVYAKLFKAFLQRNFSPKQKRHHLHSFKSLRFDYFELLKKYYEILKESRSSVHEMNSIGQNPSARNKLEALERDKDPIVASGIQRLISVGYVSAPDNASPPWPSNCLDEIFDVLD